MNTPLIGSIINPQNSAESDTQILNQDEPTICFEQLLLESEGKDKKEENCLNRLFPLIISLHGAVTERSEAAVEEGAECSLAGVEPQQVKPAQQSISSGKEAVLPFDTEKDRDIFKMDFPLNSNNSEMKESNFQWELPLDKGQIQHNIYQTKYHAGAKVVADEEKNPFQAQESAMQAKATPALQFENVKIKLKTQSGECRQEGSGLQKEAETKKNVGAKEIFLPNNDITESLFPEISAENLNFNQNIENFAEALESKVLKQMDFTEMSGAQEFELQLKPEFLGNLKIKIIKDHEGMSVKVYTSNIKVREMLSANMGTLQHQMQDKGIDLNNMEVIYHGFHGDTGTRHKEGDTQPKKSKTNNGKEKYIQSVFLAEHMETIAEDINVNGSVSYLV